MQNEPAVTWPRADLSRIPYAVYRDPQLYEDEQYRIFRGPTWSYLMLEAEIPNVGDFKRTYVGDTPVIVNRAENGEVHAFVNRCAHRGARVRREERGNAKRHICCYHSWCYNLRGELVAVPFRRGVKGKGGLPQDFDFSKHSMEKLKVETYHGVIFGTFSDTTEPLLEYLDEPVTSLLETTFHKPIKILGYQRQRFHANWKLYTDNVRDPNHAGFLHPFAVTFGLWNFSIRGGAKMDARGRHNISYSVRDSATDSAASEYRDQTASGSIYKESLQLADPTWLRNVPEHDDDLSGAILSIFPNAVFHRMQNSLATRQIRTVGFDEFELYWTYFGYEDDDDEMQQRRLQQANLGGPAGVISMEDAEAVELVFRAITREKDTHSVVEIGGRGGVENQDTIVTEVPMRGFWSYYCELMEFDPGGYST